MIKAVFFDLYNTLARFWPPREQLQAQVAKEFGLRVDPEGILLGYSAADELMSRENARRHIQKRSAVEQREFFARYEQTILRGADAEVSLDQAGQMWARLRQIPYDLELYDDVLPVLAQLKERRLVLGLISNMYRNLDELCQRLELAPYLDFVITSWDVGMEKPHPPIFLAALQKSGVRPSEAIHVGDQYGSDIIGARGVGITPVLINRDGLLPAAPDCTTIQRLAEVLDLV